MLGAFIAGGLMILTRCVSASDARQAIEWPVLISIGASFGLGAALEETVLQSLSPVSLSSGLNPSELAQHSQPST